MIDVVSDPDLLYVLGVVAATCVVAVVLVVVLTRR